MLLPPMENTLWTSIKELFLLPKFDNSSPSVTRERWMESTWIFCKLKIKNVVWAWGCVEFIITG